MKKETINFAAELAGNIIITAATVWGIRKITKAYNESLNKEVCEAKEES